MLLFCPLDIFKSIDLSGGILSYEAIQILRGVETSCVKIFKKYYTLNNRNTESINLVERVVDKKCGLLNQEILDLGEKKVESISSEIPKIAKLLIEAFGLKDVAKQQGVEFVQTMNGVCQIIKE